MSAAVAEAETFDVPFIDLADPAFSVRSQAVRDAREKSWFARTPYGLAVLRHAEMARFLNHPSLRQGSHNWPALNGITSGMFSEWWMTTILVAEGSDHRRLRKAATPAFSGRTIQRLEGDFIKLAERRIDAFVDRGRCEFMHDFANPYAAGVLTLLLGLPDSVGPRIFKLASEMGLALGVTFKQEIERIEAATEELYAYCDEIIAERRANPRDDFMTQLIATTKQPDGLAEEELRNLTLMLVFAGVDTTRNQLGLGMSVFMQHPKQWDVLAANPQLAARAAEEVMRIRPTITWVTREAVEDFVFDGVPIAKGTTIHLLSESAGTDPRVGNDDTFDIAAEHERHFGFGGGIHHCLGAQLARLEGELVFTALIERLPNLELPEKDAPAWRHSFTLRGLNRLPAIWH